MSISQRFSDLAIIFKTVVNYMKLNKDFVVCNSNIKKVIYCQWNNFYLLGQCSWIAENFLVHGDIILFVV